MLVLFAHPDFTGVPCPAIPAFASPAVAHAISCTDHAIMLVTLPVITFTEIA